MRVDGRRARTHAARGAAFTSSSMQASARSGRIAIAGAHAITINIDLCAPIGRQQSVHARSLARTHAAIGSAEYFGHKMPPYPAVKRFTSRVRLMKIIARYSD